jgi:hypothetical protein
MRTRRNAPCRVAATRLYIRPRDRPPSTAVVTRNLFIFNRLQMPRISRRFNAAAARALSLLSASDMSRTGTGR